MPGISRTFLRIAGAFLCSSFCLTTPLLAQRADRATISGVVRDAQGSAVPGATVAIRNQATGVERRLSTNDGWGVHESPPVLGTYTVRWSSPDSRPHRAARFSFAAAIRFAMTWPCSGWTGRDDQVSGRSGLDTTQPDVAHTVDQKYYEDLPFVTGSDVRLAESVLLMQPGYLPMRPNGDPIFAAASSTRASTAADEGHRELLRRRGVRLRERTPAEP